jgi:hypothetical protein
VELVVSRSGPATYEAYVHVNPKWKPEHNLELTNRDGKIVALNGEPFVLKSDAVYPSH